MAPAAWAARTGSRRRGGFSCGFLSLVATGFVGLACTGALALLGPPTGSRSRRPGAAVPRPSRVAALAGGQERVVTEAVVPTGVAAAEAVETEVVSVSGSRPAKLLYSEGVQALVAVLTRLKDAPGEGSDETALKTILGNTVNSAGEIGDKEVPESFSDDVDEAVEAAESLVNFAAQSPDEGLNWRRPLEQFSRLRLARRLPEVADELVPWDSVYPSSLASKAGVEQMELRNAVRSCARAIDLQELATWTEEEFDEAVDLMQRNDVLKEVYAVLQKAVEGTVEELISSAAMIASFLAFAPIALAALLLAGCCSLVSGGGGGGAPAGLSPEDLGVLPVYKLGGVGTL
mmetsp:Transcript_72271/g.228393  ORF Transcript_72271/g.228393 Transcript_72271/m.228393 type:complete len:346 (-) Transcript_72271:92-1129(-)